MIQKMEMPYYITLENLCPVQKQNFAELMATMLTFSDYVGEPPSYQTGLIIASSFQAWALHIVNV